MGFTIATDKNKRETFKIIKEIFYRTAFVIIVEVYLFKSQFKYQHCVNIFDIL